MSRHTSSSLTETCNNVENTCRKASFIEKLPKHKSSEGSLFRRFEHNRASGSKRRGYFPGHHQQRIVPRNDLTHNSHRFFDGHSHVGVEELESVAFDLIGLTGEVAVNVGCEDDIFAQTD